jgi:hypothetical protein
VALEREDVFAGLEDRFDALADRSEVRPVTGLVFAAWAQDRGLGPRQLGLEGRLAVEVLSPEPERQAGDHAAASRRSVVPGCLCRTIGASRCNRSAAGGSADSTRMLSDAPYSGL